MSSTGGAFTSADSPPSMSRFNCRSTWPIRRFSVTLASRPPPRIAVSTAVMHGPKLLDLLARGRALEVRADAQQLVEIARRLGAFDPTEQRRLERRPQPLRDLVEAAADLRAAGAGRAAARGAARTGPEFSSTSVPSDSDGLSRA